MLYDNTIKQKAWAKLIKYIALIFTLLTFSFLLITFLNPPNTQISYSPVVLDKNGVILYSWLTPDEQWRMKTSLDEITPELKKAIIFKEDKRFYVHSGIDPLAICRATFYNLFKNKRTSGASTITMQVARMLNRKERTFKNKLIESFIALQLEMTHSKKEILQLYYNLLPYGYNIQGVKTASYRYFQKSPDQLSLAEITTLSIIPNKPNYLLLGRDNEKIIRERNKWLDKFKKKGVFDLETINDALNEPLLVHKSSSPRNAPQLSWRLKKTFPFKEIILSTIDYNLQLKTEQLAKNYIDNLKTSGIHNAAVIIIENEGRKVLSYMGSTDFYDNHNNGQIDGILAKRSPGSTLKPFLYALAIDKGIITPKTILSDIPTNFSGYAPENFDLSFRGNISVENALKNSLNIPSVKILNDLGVKYMIKALANAEFASFSDSKKKYGLSLILGGCEVTLEELSNLFSSLANDGIYEPLKIYNEITSDQVFDIQSAKKRILSLESSRIITHILKDLSRPDLPNLPSDASATIPKIAWKTGTSYGKKDAWSIGYNEKYTVGVWIGNFNGSGSPAINGAATATPLLFQLFNILESSNNQKWGGINPLSSRLVCLYTGKVPNSFCHEQTKDFYIPGISSNEPCDHLKVYHIHHSEQYSYCTSCLPASGYKTKTYNNISPELASFYDKKHISYKKIPPHNPQCTRVFTKGEEPLITTLQDGALYHITDKNQPLVLGCNVSAEVNTVYWYINDKFFAKMNSREKVLFIPKSNNIKISCTDDKGRTSNIRIKVKFI